jgi:hypothetical protein
VRDALEWAGLVVSVLGLGFISLVVSRVYEYRRAARVPGAANGRRGHFAAILIILGRVSVLVQSGLVLIWLSAIRLPMPVEWTWSLLVLEAISVVLTMAWWMVLTHVRAIRSYRGRAADQPEA